MRLKFGLPQTRDRCTLDQLTICVSGGRQDRKRQPKVPTAGPMLRGEFAISLQVHINLRVSGWNEISDLRPQAHDARFETAQYRARAAVTANLLVDIAHESGVQIFAEKL